MDTQPNNRYIGLPEEGQPVEFVLEGRDVPIAGTYVARTFRSRWSGYSVERVRSWWSATVADSSSPASSPAHCPPCGATLDAVWQIHA